MRTRSVLIDNTLGRIFRNLTSVQNSTAESVIAGSKLTNKSITGGKAVLKVQQNLGGRGLFVIGGGLLTQIILRLTKAPKGTPAIIRVKRGITYASSTTIGDYELPGSGVSTNITFTVNETLEPGESIYFDVIAIGNISPGTGLTAIIGYYAG